MEDMEILEFPPKGYHPIVDFGQWRVAVLKYNDSLKLENIDNMQIHYETDEVFVLLNGTCSLFTAGHGEKPGPVTEHKMEPHKVFNVKKGVWHNHIMSEDGEVLIVENRDTGNGNSTAVPMSEAEKEALVKLVKGL